LPRSQFKAPVDPDAHPTIRNNQHIRRNPDVPTVDHRNKWESAALIPSCRLTNLTAIPYPGYGCVATIDCGRDSVYRVTIAAFPECTCPDFIKMVSETLGKKKVWKYCKHMYYIFRYMCKMDPKKDTFMHAPSFSYNEVIRVLEVMGVVQPDL
jgi:hypothetical protein